jgi:hypothetical protein
MQPVDPVFALGADGGDLGHVGAHLIRPSVRVCGCWQHHSGKPSRGPLTSRAGDRVLAVGSTGAVGEAGDGGPGYRLVQRAPVLPEPDVALEAVVGHHVRFGTCGLGWLAKSAGSQAFENAPEGSAS